MESIEILEKNIGVLKKYVSRVEVGLGVGDCRLWVHIRLHCSPLLVCVLRNLSREWRLLFVARRLGHFNVYSFLRDRFAKSTRPQIGWRYPLLARGRGWNRNNREFLAS